MCKVQWSHHTEEKATWEREEEFRVEFLNFFSKPSESQDEIHFKGGRFVIPQNSKFWNATKIHLILKLYINRLKLFSRI
jgi:hypothetical protein